MASVFAKRFSLCPFCYRHSCLLAVRGVYDYQATGEDEIPVKEGRMIELTTGPRGGQNYGDGWWEGRCFHLRIWRLLVSLGRKFTLGSTPSNLLIRYLFHLIW